MDLRASLNALASRLTLPRSIIITIIVGLAIRFAVAPWTSVPYDMYAFYDAQMGIMAGIGPYGNAVYSYPPLFAVVAYPFVYLASLFVDPSTFISFQPSMVDVAHTTGMLTPYVTSPVFNLAIKMPAIICDLLVGLVLYDFIKPRKGEETAKKVFVLWFLNPLVIFITAIHGQFDVIPAFLTLVGVIAFISHRYVICGTALGLGVLFKIYPAFLIVLFVVLLCIPILRNFDLKQVLSRARPLLLFIAGGILSMVSILPFLLSSGTFLDYILRRGSYATYGGINLWFLYTPLDSQGVSVSGGSTIINYVPTLILAGTLLAVIVASYWLIKRSNRTELSDITIIKAATIIITIVLLTNSVTNAQYLLWVIPFLLVWYAWEDRMLPKVAILSIVGLLFSFTLQSFYAFTYPLASFTDLASIGDANLHVIDYFNGGGVLSRTWALALVGGAGAITMLTILLPRKFDPLDRLAKLWRRKA